MSIVPLALTIILCLVFTFAVFFCANLRRASRRGTPLAAPEQTLRAEARA